MQANELRMAVTKVVEILEKANIASAVNQYRSTTGDQRTKAWESLRVAASGLVKQFATLNATERQVTEILHLNSLGSREYWVNLFNSSENPKRHQGEIVRLASRIMFASSHLPGLVGLVEQVDSEPTNNTQALDPDGEYLYIRLTDAGERASDPDRVARTIDGIDMLYSACASIASKPASDLRVDNVIAKRNRDRDIVFAGEKGSIAAVYAVIDSIPEVLAELDPEQDIDLDAVVRSLPIFNDLNKLASLGTFSKQDLKDINETLHQGALLTLESGVIPLDSSNVVPRAGSAHGADSHLSATTGRSSDAVATLKPVQTDEAPVRPLTASSPVERDEHYDRYLREREAMLRPQNTDGAALDVKPVVVGSDTSDQAQNASVERSRKSAVDDLLKSLGQSRSS